MNNEEVLINKKQNCNFCSKEAKYDGRTKMGAWAFMCSSCFKKYGVGLGLGKGQKIRMIEK